MLIRIGGLGFIDAIALWFAYALVGNGIWPAAIVLVLITLLINWLFLDDRLYPVRWLTPGLMLMLLMVVYPLIFTIYVALTNFSSGNNLTKEQVLAQLQSQYYSPADAVAYEFTAYRSPAGQYRLLLRDPQGNYFIGGDTEPLQPFQVSGEPPATIDGYEKLDLIQVVQSLNDLGKISIEDGDNLVRVTSTSRAPQQRRVYSYDPATERLTNNQTGVVYTPVRGTFTAEDGSELRPGYAVVVGLENYVRVLTDRNISGPFFSVFVWTFVYAALSVLLTFVVGLGMAMVLNDKDLPLKGVFRSIIIVPYTIPAVISTLIWVGLLNPYYGQVNLMLEPIYNLIGGRPDWFADGTWAKAGILLINTWLGYPYMMLLCLGALQSIPTDMYEAADIDGASRWTQFRSLTLPLLLVSVAPLLIGSFAFNFNNFGLIEAYNRGGPPIPGASTPAGQTDILISYTFRLAFGGGQGADYGLASAIALFIFAIVAAITIFNFRYTKQLEELT
jgi:ABC-type sugar transport system permease subunit